MNTYHITWYPTWNFFNGKIAFLYIVKIMQFLFQKHKSIFIGVNNINITMIGFKCQLIWQNIKKYFATLIFCMQKMFQVG